MSKKELQDKFRKLMSQTKLKKELNDWCRKTYSTLLPMWFSNKATDEEKEQFVNDLEAAINSGDWSTFSIEQGEPASEVVVEEKTTEPQPPATTAPAVEEEAAEPEVAAKELAKDNKKWSDDDIKQLLEEHGYKAQLVPDSRDAIVTYEPVVVKVPAEIAGGTLDGVIAFITENLGVGEDEIKEWNFASDKK